MTDTRVASAEDSSNFANILSVDPSNYPNILLNIRVDTSAGRNGTLTQKDFRIVEDDVEQAIKSFSYTSTNADIVFVFDDTGSMSGEIDAMKSGVKDLTDMIDERGIGARYALVSFKDEVETDIGFTNKSNELKSAVDGLLAEGGYDDPEDDFDAIEAALDLGFRSEAQKVIVDITDSLSHYRGDGSNFSGYTFDEVARDLATGGITYIAVAPDIDDPNASKKTLANEVGGLWIDIASADFSAILDDITEVVVTAYVLEYLTSTRPGSSRNVGVTVTDPKEGTDTETETLDVPDDANGKKSPADLDLRIPDVTVKPGSEAPIKLSLKNKGKNSASNPAIQTRYRKFPNDWKTSNTTAGGGKWNDTGRWTTGQLRSGKTETPSFTLKIPSDTKAGEYTITADALGSSGTVVDTASATITVEKSPADLSISIPDVTVKPGGKAPIKLSLKNTGKNSASNPAIQTRYREFPDGWKTSNISSSGGKWNDTGKWTTGQLRSGKTETPSFTLKTPSGTKAGEYTITADALSSSGTVVDTASATITVEKQDINESPKAEFTYSPENPSVGDEVTFDASSSDDPDGTIAMYEWDFNNDGSYEANGKQATNTFKSTGKKSVRLRVSDKKGDTTTNQIKVPIAEADLNELKQRKLKTATTIDDYSVTTLFDTGEQQQVKPILEDLIRDTNHGKIDKDVTEEAIDRMVKAEGLTQETLAAVGTEDMITLPDQNISLADETVDFAFDIIVELLFLLESTILKLGENPKGFDDFSLDAGIESINSVVTRLMDWAYSRIDSAIDIESTLRSGAKTVAQNVSNGSISSVKQAEAELDNVVDQALNSARHSTQAIIEQGSAGDIEDGLNEVNTFLQSSAIQDSDGLQGDHDGAVKALNEGMQRLTSIATTTDEFLKNLKSEIAKYDIVDRSFKLARADNLLGALWNVAQIVLTVAGGIGKVVSNAIGSATGLYAIKSLQYNHYYSLTGIAEGQPPADKLTGSLGQMAASPVGTIPRSTGSKFYNVDFSNPALSYRNQVIGTGFKQSDGSNSTVMGLLKQFKQAVLNGDQKQARKFFSRISKRYKLKRMSERLRLRQALAIQQVVETKEKHRSNAHSYLQSSIVVEFKRLAFNLLAPIYLADSSGTPKNQVVNLLDQLISQENKFNKRGTTVNKISNSTKIPPSITVTATDAPRSTMASDLPVKISITTENVGDSVAKGVGLKVVSDIGLTVSPRTVQTNRIKPNSKVMHEFQVSGAKKGGHTISFEITSSNAGTASEELFLNIDNPTTQTPSSNPDNDKMPGWLPIAGGAGALGLGAGVYGYLRKDTDEQEDEEEEESQWLQ